jgi:tripartite-type tricarboxylate transporter receptor subunit TctC
MKRFISCAMRVVAMNALAIGVAIAQSYPAKPLRIIVPHPAGTPVDLIVRVVGEKLREAGGQPVIVENRFGASGGIGAEAVARAAPDGYTLLATIDTTANVAKLIYPKFPVDPASEFSMVAMLGDRGVQVFVVPADSRAQNLNAFIGDARAAAQPLIMAQAEPGTPGHLVGAVFARAAKTELQFVSFRGPVAAVQEVIAGRAAASLSPMSTVVPFVTAGKIRALMVTGNARSEFLPQVPTSAEAGFAEIETRFNWIALFAPAGAPLDTQEWLNRESRRISALPEVREQFRRLALIPGNQSLAELRDLWSADRAYWNRVVPQLNIKLD